MNHVKVMERTKHILANQVVRKRCWMRHTLRKPANSITRNSFPKNTHDKRKRGRIQNMWRGEFETDE